MVRKAAAFSGLFALRFVCGRLGKQPLGYFSTHARLRFVLVGPTASHAIRVTQGPPQRRASESKERDT